MLCYDQDQTQQLPHASPPAALLSAHISQLLGFFLRPQQAAVDMPQGA